MDDFSSETVGDYKVSTEDGVLESFKSTRTIKVSEGKKRSLRVTTTSLTRVE